MILKEGNMLECNSFNYLTYYMYLFNKYYNYNFNFFWFLKFIVNAEMLQHLAPLDLCRKLERIGCSSVRHDVTNNAVSDVTSMKYACVKTKHSESFYKVRELEQCVDLGIVFVISKKILISVL